ncbi:MAG: DnaJ domain-containing protein, partial [bacterium]
MKSRGGVSRGPRRQWTARIGIGLLGSVGGPAGLIFGFGVGVLLDHLISRRRFLAEIRRVVHERQPADEVELYTVIALFLRGRNSEAGALQRYLEQQLNVVFSGPADRFVAAVDEALENYSHEELWTILRETASPEMVRVHRDVLRRDVRSDAGTTALSWDSKYSPILGLSAPADEHEIRASFRRLAFESHPDSAGSCERESGRYSFSEIPAAYEALISRFEGSPA